MKYLILLITVFITSFAYSQLPVFEIKQYDSDSLDKVLLFVEISNKSNQNMAVDIPEYIELKHDDGNYIDDYRTLELMDSYAPGVSLILDPNILMGTTSVAVPYDNFKMGYFYTEKQFIDTTKKQFNSCYMDELISLNPNTEIDSCLKYCSFISDTSQFRHTLFNLFDFYYVFIPPQQTKAFLVGIYDKENLQGEVTITFKYQEGSEFSSIKSKHDAGIIVPNKRVLPKCSYYKMFDFPGELIYDINR